MDLARMYAEGAQSITAKHSLRALSTLYFGRMNRQQDIINQAFAPYGAALRELNKDLQDPSKATSLSVVISAITLQTFEVSNPLSYTFRKLTIQFIAFSSKSGWLEHAGGIGRLIELRGPEQHQLEPDKEILDSNRVLIVLGCLVKRKRCFLERSEWKIIPWALEPELKQPIHYQQDMLCDIPGLLEDASALHDEALRSDERVHLHTRLSGNIYSHLGALYQWRWEWERNNPHCCYETEKIQAPGEAQPIFPAMLSFASLIRANEINIYNCILLLLLKLGSEVIGPSFNFAISNQTHLHNTSSNPLYLPGQAPNPLAIAAEICRSVDYHLLEHQNSAGAFFLLFPLRLAYQTFNEGTNERRWVVGVLEKIAVMSGFEIGRGLSVQGDLVE